MKCAARNAVKYAASVFAKIAEEIPVNVHVNTVAMNTVTIIVKRCGKKCQENTEQKRKNKMSVIEELDNAIGSLQEHWHTLKPEHIQEWLDEIEKNVNTLKTLEQLQSVDVGDWNFVQDKCERLENACDDIHVSRDVIKQHLEDLRLYARNNQGLIRARDDEALKALEELNAIWNNSKSRGEPNMIEAWNFVISHEETIRKALGG